MRNEHACETDLAAVAVVVVGPARVYGAPAINVYGSSV